MLFESGFILELDLLLDGFLDCLDELLVFEHGMLGHRRLHGLGHIRALEGIEGLLARVALRRWSRSAAL